MNQRCSTLILLLLSAWADAEEASKLGDTRTGAPLHSRLATADNKISWPFSISDSRSATETVLLMEPIQSDNLKALFPETVFFRLISSDDIIHRATFSTLFIHTKHRAPGHLKNDSAVLQFLDDHTAKIQTSDDALKWVKAFAHLRSYKIITTEPAFKDFREASEQPKPAENDYKFIAVEQPDTWTVYATLFTSEFTSSYERCIFTIYKPPASGMNLKERTLIKIGNAVL